MSSSSVHLTGFHSPPWLSAAPPYVGGQEKGQDTHRSLNSVTSYQSTSFFPRVCVQYVCAVHMICVGTCRRVCRQMYRWRSGLTSGASLVSLHFVCAGGGWGSDMHVEVRGHGCLFSQTWWKHPDLLKHLQPSVLFSETPGSGSVCHRGVHLFLPPPLPQHWDHRLAPPCSAVTQPLGTQAQVLILHGRPFPS